MFVDDIVLISDSDTSELQIKIEGVVTELETWFNRNEGEGHAHNMPQGPKGVRVG
jgi:hypothetical protein